MTTETAAAYRHALRWYPADWRDTNAESTVSAYLDRDDATGVAGPTRRDRRDLARAGVLELLASSVRRGRRATTAIGVLFVLAAFLHGSTLRDLGARALTFASGGFVDAMTHSYPGLLLSALIVAVAWLVAAVVACRRGRVLTAAACLAATVTGPVWAYRVSSWPSSLQLGDSTSPTPALVILGLATAAALLLAALAAERSGILARPAATVIVLALAARIAGFCGILLLVHPGADLLATACSLAAALLAPLSEALTGACFVLLSRSHLRRDSPATGDARSHPIPAVARRGGQDRRTR